MPPSKAKRKDDKDFYPVRRKIVEGKDLHYQRFSQGDRITEFNVR